MAKDILGALVDLMLPGECAEDTLARLVKERRAVREALVAPEDADLAEWAMHRAGQVADIAVERDALRVDLETLKTRTDEHIADLIRERDEARNEQDEVRRVLLSRVTPPSQPCTLATLAQEAVLRLASTAGEHEFARRVGAKLQEALAPWYRPGAAFGLEVIDLACATLRKNAEVIPALEKERDDALDDASASAERRQKAEAERDEARAMLESLTSELNKQTVVLADRDARVRGLEGLVARTVVALECPQNEALDACGRRRVREAERESGAVDALSRVIVRALTLKGGDT